ncbi:hypothetical protein BJ165DRAFT_1431260 [Panaeolus papilionaceus]|nr:hypothetical protein BJ165DRAFT_1431260 [Panaeolus papilionaceus]
MLGRRSLRQLNTTLRSLTRSASSSTPAVKINEVAVEAVKKEPVTLQQAPNHPTTWSTSQRPRPGPGSGPRFEQTAMDLQPNPLSAMDMIAQEPIRLVHGRKAVCDGGGGPLGHPKVYINLDQPGPRPCGYVQNFLRCGDSLLDMTDCIFPDPCLLRWFLCAVVHHEQILWNSVRARSSPSPLIAIPVCCHMKQL